MDIEMQSDGPGMRLTEVIDLEILQKIQDAFAAAFKMPSLIIDLQGNSITKPSCFVGFCRYVRSTKLGELRCKAFDAAMVKDYADITEPVISRGCVLKNIMHAAAPINVNGKHLASFAIGQMIDGMIDEQELRNYALEIGVDPVVLLEEALTLIPMDQTNIQNAMNFLSVLTEQIGELGFQILQNREFIRKQGLYENEIRKLSRAMEQVPATVVITNIQGDIEYVNPKFTEVTGYSYEEAIGKNPRILKSDEAKSEHYLDLWDTITKGNEWRGEFHNKKKNGELYWELATISPIRNDQGETTHYLAVKEDITFRKQQEAELRIAKENAEESDRLKTAFINNISHEIRTPLNGILGFGQLMAHENLSQQERSEYFKILKNSTTRLVQTITDYMDISLISSGSITANKKNIRVNQFLHDLYANTKNGHHDKNVDILLYLPDESSELVLNTDAELLRKIMVHLLSNALKFTRAGSVSLGYTIKQGLLEFFVRDTGVGIEKEQQQRIFEPFRQEDFTNTRGYEGSGLGLSIVQGLVTLLGGEVTLISHKEDHRSEQLSGSLITFTIPHQGENTVLIAESRRAGSAPEQMKPLILVAEDDESSFLLLRAMLPKETIGLLYAVNGVEAVALCKQNPAVSLVLMDIKMPVMDGLEATRLIREFREDVPIIALTAYAQTGDEYRILEAGCDGYLAKPINRERLFELIGKHAGIKI
jgi:PAS domain S-box-containing protein